MRKTDSQQAITQKNSPGLFIWPLILTFLFFVVVALPIELIGCRTRGLLAVTIALGGGVLGIISAIIAVVKRARGQSDSFQRIIAAVAYAIPCCYILLEL